MHRDSPLSWLVVSLACFLCMHQLPLLLQIECNQIQGKEGIFVCVWEGVCMCLFVFIQNVA